MMVGSVGCAGKNKFGVENRNNRNNIQKVRYNPNTNPGFNGTYTDDRNHLNDTNVNYPNPTYPNTTNPTVNPNFWNNAEKMNTKSERLAHRCANIAAKQKNVKSAQTYVAGNTVFVTLEVKEGVNDSKVINNVRSALKRQVKGKNFNIMSDIGSFDQMKKGMRGVTNDNAPINKIF